MGCNSLLFNPLFLWEQWLAVLIVGTDFVCRPGDSGEYEEPKEDYGQMVPISITFNLILTFITYLKTWTGWLSYLHLGLWVVLERIIYSYIVKAIDNSWPPTYLCCSCQDSRIILSVFQASSIPQHLFSTTTFFTLSLSADDPAFISLKNISYSMGALSQLPLPPHTYKCIFIWTYTYLLPPVLEEDRWADSSRLKLHSAHGLDAISFSLPWDLSHHCFLLNFQHYLC